MILLGHSTPHSRIMEPFDVVENISSGFITCSVSAMIRLLSLEHAEESLAGRIVTTVTDSAHGTDERIALQEALVVTAPKLTPSIGMQYH